MIEKEKQYRFTQNIYKIVIMCMALCGLLLIFWGFFASKQDIRMDDVQERRRLQPEEIVSEDAYTQKYIFKDVVSKGERLCLHFVSEYQTVRVLLNGVLLYSLENGSTPVGRVPGRMYHFVKLPSLTGKLEVILQNGYLQRRKGTPDFWIGDRQTMFQNRIIRSMPAVLVYFLTFIAGISVLLFWRIVRDNLKNSRESFYFSMLLITVGLWFLRGSEFVNLLFSNHFALSFMGHILFLQIPLIFFGFAVSYWDISLKKRWKDLYYMIACVNAGICILLHIGNVRDFYETTLVGNILLQFAFLAMFAGMYAHYKEYGFDYKVKATFVPTCLILLSIFGDYVGFYKNMEDAYRIGGVVSLFFVVCISGSVIYDLSLQLKEGQKNAIYKKMAVTDLLTGLYNRNAYENWEREYHGPLSAIGIAICDLNDLKYYNDSFGHEKGDAYIKKAAEMILTALKEEGICYRIGGDEFLIVWINKREAAAEKFWERLEGLEKECNMDEASFKIQIAYGYARAEQKDTAISDIVKRADNKMYQHKNLLKKEGSLGKVR